MDERSASLTPETLLAHAGWLRQLAASLVADPGAADDVVQETWLAALRRPPAPGRPLEPWLARVARNLAFRRRRAERNRAAHELAAPSAREEPTPEETVERIALQRSVAEAVLAIEEPFRTAIVQRYFEGRSSAEIARRFGVPAGTVRWRLKRGLDELRERLDGRFGSRASWCVLLAPLARRATPAPVATPAAGATFLSTVLVMSTMHATVVLAALALVAGVVWWSASERRAPARTPPAPTGLVSADALRAPAFAPSDAAASAPTAARAAREEPPPPGAPEAPPAAASVPARAAAIEARFVDAHGAPWSGVTLAAAPEPSAFAWDWGAPAESAADGRVRLELAFPPLRGEDGLIDSRTVPFVASRPGCASVALRVLVRAGETAHLGDVVLAPGVRLSGRVVDADGRAVADARVGTTASELPPEEDGRLFRHGSPAFDLPVTRSAADGAFELDGVGAGSWRLWGHAPGMRYGWSEPLAVTAERDVVGLELVLEPLRVTDRIEGRVVDAHGAPVRDGMFCRVHDARHGGFGGAVQVDGEGRFAIVVEHDGETWDLTALDWSGRFATTTVAGVRPGTLDVLLCMPEQRFFEVRVRDADARPLAGARFSVSAGGAWTDVSAESTAHGLYRVPFPESEFRIEVTVPGFRAGSRGPLAPVASPAPLDFVLRRASAVRGRVLRDGRAVAGARVELRAADEAALETVDGFRCVMSSQPDVEGQSGADGAFELFYELDDPFWIRAVAEGTAPAELGPIDPGRLGAAPEFELVLSEGGVIEGRVLAPAGRAAEGTIVAIHHGDGAPRTVRAGPGGAFRFERLAPGAWQVLARDAEFDPDHAFHTSLREAQPIEWSCEVVAGRTTRFDLDLR